MSEERKYKIIPTEESLHWISYNIGKKLVPEIERLNNILLDIKKIFEDKILM